MGNSPRPASFHRSPIHQPHRRASAKQRTKGLAQIDDASSPFPTACRTAALPASFPRRPLYQNSTLVMSRSPPSEIEYGTRRRSANENLERVHASLVVPVLDLDTEELHGATGHAKLKCPVRLVAVALDLVVVHLSLDLLFPSSSHAAPRCAPTELARPRISSPAATVVSRYLVNAERTLRMWSLLSIEPNLADIRTSRRSGT